MQSVIAPTPTTLSTAAGTNTALTAFVTWNTRWKQAYTEIFFFYLTATVWERHITEKKKTKNICAQKIKKKIQVQPEIKLYYVWSTFVLDVNFLIIRIFLLTEALKC